LAFIIIIGIVKVHLMTAGKTVNFHFFVLLSFQASCDTLPLTEVAVKNPLFTRPLALGAGCGFSANRHYPYSPAGQAVQVSAFPTRSGTPQTGDHGWGDFDLAGGPANGATAGAILIVHATSTAVSASDHVHEALYPGPSPFDFAKLGKNFLSIFHVSLSLH
jgi:hypothetical protein